jgi:Peptidase MA superfamily
MFRMNGLRFLVRAFLCLFNLWTLTVAIGCTAQSNKISDWKTNCSVTKTIRNITFSFPSNGFAYDNRDSIINACFDVIKHDLSVIQQKEYTDTIVAEFLSSRKEMLENTGYPSSESAVPQLKKIWFVVDKDISPLMTHEFMHMITINLWGQPPQQSYWLKEGIATYAQNNCNGFAVEQIYAFFEKKNMLIATDSLTANFYSQPMMIAYHQSAYISQYLIETYGVQKFSLLWQSGIDGFEKIYGIQFKQLLLDIKNKLDKKYPEAPDIDWNNFKCL